MSPSPARLCAILLAGAMFSPSRAANSRAIPTHSPTSVNGAHEVAKGEYLQSFRGFSKPTERIETFRDANPQNPSAGIVDLSAKWPHISRF
jgi:hypothetical protein